MSQKLSAGPAINCIVGELKKRPEFRDISDEILKNRVKGILSSVQTAFKTRVATAVPQAVLASLVGQTFESMPRRRKAAEFGISLVLPADAMVVSRDEKSYHYLFDAEKISNAIQQIDVAPRRQHDLAIEDIIQASEQGALLAFIQARSYSRVFNRIISHGTTSVVRGYSDGMMKEKDLKFFRVAHALLMDNPPLLSEELKNQYATQLDMIIQMIERRELVPAVAHAKTSGAGRG